MQYDGLVSVRKKNVTATCSLTAFVEQVWVMKGLRVSSVFHGQHSIDPCRLPASVWHRSLDHLERLVYVEQ